MPPVTPLHTNTNTHQTTSFPTLKQRNMFDLNPQFPNHHANSYRHGGIQFRLETMEEDSGVCSPPLWQNDSPPDSPVKHANPRILSPMSRAQAIARGKREIMEMVEHMPETSYELSLKDLVEQRKEYTDVDHETRMEENEERSILSRHSDSQRWRKNKKPSIKRQESSKKTGKVILINGSMNHNNKGFLINMFFPFSIRSKKKNSSITTRSSFGKNSIKYPPKPELLEKHVGSGDRRDWWWIKFTGSGDSESLGITSSSSGDSTHRSGSSGSSAADSLHSNSSRKNNNCCSGCWSFFPFRKRKS